MPRLHHLCATLVVLALSAPAGLTAQESRIGIRAGWVSSDVSSETAPNTDELGETDAGSGITIGALYELRGARWFGRVEADFIQKGFTATDADPNIDAELDYFEIPLLFGVRLGNASLVPSLYAGPWLAFEVGCSLSASVGGSTQEIDCDDPDGLDERRTRDWGFAAGAGLEYSVGTVGLFIDARWAPGISNLDTAPDNENVNAKTRAWVFAAGASFRLGGS